MNKNNCYIRPVVWRGSQQMGLSTNNADINVAIALWDDWASYFKIEDRLAGLKLITSPWKRPAPDTAPFDAKASGPYIICTMSKQYAEDKGYNDALMLDYRGYVAEGTGANIFFIKGREIHTPIPDCFLNGITRQTVIALARDKGFTLIEKHLLPEDIGNYDEAFLTGTAAEITPIKSIDEIIYNTGDNTVSYGLMNDFTNLVNSSL
jgi:branched-chain amino acid aminotransferase